MWILFCIVIGILVTLGIAFAIVMLLPQKGSLKSDQFQTLEFEIEIDHVLRRGKIRYRNTK
jgi:hypothetical protein